MHFILMSKDIEVAKICIDRTFQNTEITELYQEEFLPLHILYNTENQNDAFNHWFWHRCIPPTRDAIDNFLCHTKCCNVYELAIKNRALSITDPYWIKKEGEQVKWENINLISNHYSHEIGNIIVGTVDKDITEYKSPDLTTNGWLRKAWRREDGKDYLYKLGSFPYFQEPLNEVFASELAKKFCTLDFVEYQLKQINGMYCSVCENFVKPNMEFVPAFSIYQTKERPFYMEPYEFLVERCKEFGIPDSKQKIGEMMSFDYLISNTDRHMGNFGFMRNVDTLKFTGMAPLFDNGTSLWTVTTKPVIQCKTNINEPFKNWQEEQIKMIKNFDSLNITAVKDMGERLFDVLSNAGMELERVDDICSKYNERWNRLNKIIEHNFEKKLYKTMELEDELAR